MQRKKNKTFIVRLMSLVTVVLVLATAAVLRDGKLFGYGLGKADAGQPTTLNGDTLVVEPNGWFTVNTKLLAGDVQGYGGAVPLKIHIDGKGVIRSIEALPNAESPEFFGRAKVLLNRWKGKTVEMAMSEDVDVVTGATFSSRAIISNVKRGLDYADKKVLGGKTYYATVGGGKNYGWTIAGVAALVVALLGAVVPLLVKKRSWHYVQMVLNVTVLGLWTGTFVSYALFLRLFAGGVSLASLGTLAAPLVMTIVAVVYPLVGRSGYYCANVCPFGSAQELAGKLLKRKGRLSPQLTRCLTVFRDVLWGVLMALMLTGTWTAWMDYELFAAFVYSSAPVGVVLVALLFLAVSVWIPRPYCRFVCPTGMLIRY